MESAKSNVAKAARVVVATTVALSFISYWRGASIVLSDLASSMFYAGSIAEQAIGPSAAWYVLAVMLFSFAVRAVYMESCGMFVRGGVYIVVKDSMGPIIARLSVSSLVFDYILTGPISVVSAGQYLAGLSNEVAAYLHHPQWQVDPNLFSVFFSIIVTLFFWWSNIKGIHESSTAALRIMQITTVMVAALLIWCPLTIIMQGKLNLPPSPVPSHLVFTDTSAGFLRGTRWLTFPVFAVVIAFGHSLLSMSGFETLAQVYREIASPKMKNLKIAGSIVCWYAVICTGVITLLATMIMPAAMRQKYSADLLGGLAMSLAGPYALRLAFHVFVVVVGVLILAGAVNTSLIGANGVLNRVAEDGVLLDWFRKPHRKFGTTYRIVNLVTILQVATILLSRGDVDLLGEAYAFGVVWSFALKALGVLVLRFQRHDQEYKVPFNLRIAGREIPIGLAATTLVLLMTAIANLFSKRNATIYGIAFTIAFFILFTLSENINMRKHKQKKNLHEHSLEEFNLHGEPQLDTALVRARPGSILVAVRDAQNLQHLRRTLQKTDLRRNDIVVMTVRQSAPDSEYNLRADQVFGPAERELFTSVVSLAEKEGKSVELLVVPALDPFEAVVETANRLRVSRVVTGVSVRMTSDELARRIGLAWEKLPEPRQPFSLEIIASGRPSSFVNLGPHPPRLWPEDVDRLHHVWLDVSESVGSTIHHRDVVGLALRRLEGELRTDQRSKILEQIKAAHNHHAG